MIGARSDLSASGICALVEDVEAYATLLHIAAKGGQSAHLFQGLPAQLWRQP